jgi:hypothetical protein
MSPLCDKESDHPETPVTNPELERKARLPSLAKLTAWWDSNEAPTTGRRITEGVICAIIGGVIVWLTLP